MLRRFFASKASEGFLNGPSAAYVEDMYAAWKNSPSSVHASWASYFKNVDQGQEKPWTAPPNLISTTTDIGAAHVPSDFQDQMKVQLMVRAYQVRGHHIARLDPLDINFKDVQQAPELDYKHYGFKESDLSRKFHLGSGILPEFQQQGKTMTLDDIIKSLKNIYCGSIGIEYGHIPDRVACDWIRKKFEVPVKYRFTKEQKLMILDRLMWSDSFERFVATKYPSEKRFGLEGCESLIPGMKALIDKSVTFGVNSIVMGMPHRGRLNVLSNVVRKPNESIFSEFSGSKEDSVEGSGDVKYHLGMNYERPTPCGKMVNLSLAANPSHLEAVDPVVEGKVRGIQFYQNDEPDRNKAMAILLHGDAAFSGQGVVYETLGFSDLPYYTTGGSIHIIVNNQVGFTTDPRFSRSTPYCSDVAKTVSVPILHINGDDVEAVVFAAEFAAEWRAKFKKHCVLDIVCYRKYGHNEIDQPGFTQPLMYQRINKMKPVIEKYTEQLLSEGSVTQDEIDKMKSRIMGILEEQYEASKTYKGSSKEWVSSLWSGHKSPSELASQTVSAKATGVRQDVLEHIGMKAASYPKDFNVHSNLARILRSRQQSIKEGEGIDWATAESMAFGSLLAEGTHVRLSGQDVERGTFSQRHALLHDQKTEAQFIPLNNITGGGKIENQSPFTVCNSSLSEFGCLGFELGYSLVHPNQLILWEAQFGDFANNAQVMIDQFIASGEQKWLQRSALTMLLPHGYDGQGPEHSSARLERYLQLCDEDPYYMPSIEDSGKHSYPRQHQDCNYQVVYPTVPSNYFHVLRRQVVRDFRKPLIVITSKALLRHPLARSSITEFIGGTFFQRVIPEVLHANPLEKTSLLGNGKESRIPYAMTSPEYPPLLEGSAKRETHKQSLDFKLLPPNKIKTLIFCSGQVYYLLARSRALNKLNHIAIVRIEQLNPFPFWEVKSVTDFYPNVEEIVYCQEESFNSGSWSFIEPRLDTSIRETDWYKSGKGKKWAEKLDSLRTPGGLKNAKIGLSSVRGGRLIRYAGRDISAAPATGIKKVHAFEEKTLVAEAFFGGKLPPVKTVDQGVPVFI